MAHDLGQQIDRMGLDDRFVVLGAILLGDHAGIGELVEARLLKADGERFDRQPALARHGSHHRPGIDSPAEKGAQRHVGDHADAHRFVEQLAQGLACLGFG